MSGDVVYAAAPQRQTQVEDFRKTAHFGRKPVLRCSAYLCVRLRFGALFSTKLHYFAEVPKRCGY